MARKTQYSKDDIIEAGLEVLNEHGWEGLTPKSTARMLGASTMPIFSHFSSMDEFRDGLMERAWEMLTEYVSRSYTGDPWVDQAVGYVLFARDHSRLFNCMQYVPLQELKDRRYEFWFRITRNLESHPSFQGMDAVHSGWIRYIRSLLTHGIAVSVSSGLTTIWENAEVIEQMMALCSEILYEGFSARGERLKKILGGVPPENLSRLSGR